MKLNFGRTIHNGGSHTLGKLICSGKSISPVYPRSCADLWRIGHTLNGLYPIQVDTHVEFVHCDFTLGNIKWLELLSFLTCNRLINHQGKMWRKIELDTWT
jgi:hypothetical protein